MSSNDVGKKSVDIFGVSGHRITCNIIEECSRIELLQVIEHTNVYTVCVA